MAKQKIHSTTQNFTEIVDIGDNVVFLKSNNACSIIEVSSVNFFLLSQDEQNARIYGYASLLNSLSFPIQILIVSKRVDISSYITLLEQRIKSAQNARLREHISLYRDFIKELVSGEGLLDKRIYVVVPFSLLELGPVKGGAGSLQKKGGVSEKVKETLLSKTNNVVAQVERMGLTARVLGADALIKLFYELFNQEVLSLDFDTSDVKNIIL